MQDREPVYGANISKVLLGSVHRAVPLARSDLSFLWFLSSLVPAVAVSRS